MTDDMGNEFVDVLPDTHRWATEWEADHALDDDRIPGAVWVSKGNEQYDCAVPIDGGRGAHTFTVTVSGCAEYEAAQVMSERIGHDEDYGFDYRIDWTTTENGATA